jgi:hypothetical protein
MGTGMTPMTAKGDKYRAKEEERREHAKRSFDSGTKRTLEELARKCHEMADRADRNADKRALARRVVS